MRSLNEVTQRFYGDVHTQERDANITYMRGPRVKPAKKDRKRRRNTNAAYRLEIPAWQTYNILDID